MVECELKKKKLPFTQFESTLITEAADSAVARNLWKEQPEGFSGGGGHLVIKKTSNKRIKQNKKIQPRDPEL